MERKQVSFNDESVLDYCNIMGYHYREEVPVQYLLSMLREFSSFSQFREKKIKQIRSKFEQSERIMTLENYSAELECLNTKRNFGQTFYEYQFTLYKKHKVIAKIVAEFSVEQ